MTATLDTPVATVTHVFAGQLAKALDLTVPATGASNVLDWTRMVRLESKSDGTLHVSATDMKWHVHTHAKTIGQTGEWAATVDARKLHSLIGSFPAEAQVLLNPRNNRITVVCGRSNTSLPSGDPEVFPVLPDNAHSTIVGSAAGWARAVSYASWAASGPAIAQHNAVQFKFARNPDGPDWAVASATDGNCAAVWSGMDARVTLPDGVEAAEFRLPADTLRDAAAIFRRAGDAEVTCRMMGGTGQRPNMAVFSVPEPTDEPDAEPRTTVAVRCLEGPIYDLAGTLEKVEQTPMGDSGGSFLASPAAMASALRRVLIVGQSEARSGYVPVKLTIGEGGVRMQAAGSQTGEGLDEFDSESEVGRGNTITLSASYLKGALEACQVAGGDVSVRFTEAVSPAVFSPGGDDTLAILVMSMHPQGEPDADAA